MTTTDRTTGQEAPASAAAPGPGRKLRGDIQGLRAVAVGTVLLSHVGLAGFSGGYVGVDVFFVVSGYLITALLAREIQRSGRISVLDFYARRARRILPAASVTLLGIVVASWLAFGYIRLSQVLNEVAWAGFFGANLHFAREGADYFAADGFVSPVQHFWSLAVEEQFYLLWPILVAAVMLARPRRPRLALGVVLSLAVAGSLAWSAYQTTGAPESAYFSTFTRAWELGAGALLALGSRFVAPLTRGFCSVLSWVGLGLIALATVRYTEATPFPGTAALLPVIGTVLILAGGMKETPHGASWLLDRAPLRRLGDISYSLYLVHWPVLMIPEMAGTTELGWFDKVTLVLLSITLATLSYHWVETPFRTSGFWRDRRHFSLGLWPAAASLVLTVVTVVGTQTTTVAEADRVVVDPQQQAAPRPDLTLAVKRAASRSISRSPLPRKLTPSPLELRDDNWRLPARCVDGSVDGTKHDICSFGDLSSDRVVVLYGDSHIGMWTEPIAAVAKKTGWRVVVFLKVGCPPIDVPVWRTGYARPYRECTQYRSWAYRQIARLKPERIIATGYTQVPLADTKTGKELSGDTGAAGTALMGPAMRSALARLTAVTKDVTVLSDTTTLPEQPVDCLGRRGATLRTCAVGMNKVTAQRNALWRQATVDAGGRWINTASWLCSNGVCPLVVGNVVVYTDTHHLTRTFARTLIPQLTAALKL